MRKWRPSPRAKDNVSFNQALLRPRAVNHHAFVVCFRNPQHFYDNVFVVGVDLQTALLVRRYVLIFFHSVFPDLNHSTPKPHSLEMMLAGAGVIIESGVSVDVNLAVKLKPFILLHSFRERAGKQLCVFSVQLEIRSQLIARGEQPERIQVQEYLLRHIEKSPS